MSLWMEPNQNIISLLFTSSIVLITLFHSQSSQNQILVLILKVVNNPLKYGIQEYQMFQNITSNLQELNQFYILIILIMINRLAKKVFKGPSLTPFFPKYNFSYKIYKNSEVIGQPLQDPKTNRTWRLRMLFAIAFLYYMYSESGFEFGKPFKKQVSGMTSQFGSMMSNSKTNPKKTMLSDIQGIDQFKDEFQQIIDYLKQLQKYIDSGAKLPKGILLVGSPGTGKTMMARALATQANCSFISKNGSQFDGMFLGSGSSAVRKLFEEARSKTPAIIFIDEIDSIAGNRASMYINYSNGTLNQLLTQMDGFQQADNIVVIGATNFQESLDPAIKRAGRFDKTIHIPLPDIKGREQIFQHYLKKIKYQGATPKKLAQLTYGFAGANIQNMVNTAILNAVKLGRDYATEQDFSDAYDRLTMGIGRKSLYMKDKDKLITAYHEGGHAITTLFTEGSIPLHKVTCLPRGGALGFTAMVPKTDPLSINKMQILAKIDVAMGGKVAEEIFFGQDSVSSGCSSDLHQATKLAYNFVKVNGMQSQISLISESEGIKTSQQYNYQMDKQINNVLSASYSRVKKLLTQHRKDIQALAKQLIVKETLTVQEVRNLLKIN